VRHEIGAVQILREGGTEQRPAGHVQSYAVVEHSGGSKGIAQLRVAARKIDGVRIAEGDQLRLLPRRRAQDRRGCRCPVEHVDVHRADPADRKAEHAGIDSIEAGGRSPPAEGGYS
jgi:hypothetical protein